MVFDVLAVSCNSGGNKDNPVLANEPTTPVASAAQAPATIFVGTVYNIFHEEYSTDEEYFKQADKDIALMKASHISYVMINPLFQEKIAEYSSRPDPNFICHECVAYSAPMTQRILCPVCGRATNGWGCSGRRSAAAEPEHYVWGHIA